MYDFLITTNSQNKKSDINSFVMQGLLYIKTYGCQMNFYDSSKIADLLQPHGFTITENPENADVIVFNTCHIRENAAQKVYSALGRISAIKEKKKKQGKKVVVIVAGCTAQSEGEEIIKRAKCVDIVVGPQSYQDLPMLITNVKRSNSWAVSLDFKEEEKFDILEKTGNSQGYSASISTMEGCDKFCHFCVVPYTRGSEFSRSVKQIYDETVKLVKDGTGSILLLGQNISAYKGIGVNGKEWNLGQLISLLSEIDGLLRINYITSHPIDMEKSGLFEAHATQTKLAPFVHLPIQSGSDKVLKMMNRKYDVTKYTKIIEHFRSVKPDIAFSSDFIVGYPGETEEDFQKTLEVTANIKYAQSYSFKYSKRPGTPASIMQDQVPEEVKQERLARLQKLISEQQIEFNSSKIGKIVNVVIDELGASENQVIGRSEYMQSVVIDDGIQYINSIRKVKVTSATQNSLRGIVVS